MAHAGWLPALTLCGRKSLRETLERYVVSVEPLLTRDQLRSTQSAVMTFARPGGLGETLQKMLEERAADPRQPSWLERWYDDMYLMSSRSLLDYNYYFALKPLKDLPGVDVQCAYAAAFLHNGARFKQQLDTETLEPDRQDGVPLCMSQYPRLFSCSRVPGMERDSVVTYQKHPWSETSEYMAIDPIHAVVGCRGNMYTVPLYDSRGNVHSLAALYRAVCEIKQRAETGGPGPCLGAITTLPRVERYEAYQHLQQASAENKSRVETLQQAAMVLFLDQRQPDSPDQLARFLHLRDGFDCWYLKHQFVVFANGQTGINFEEAVGDGSTTIRLADYLHDESNQLDEQRFLEPPRGEAAETCTVQDLVFDISGSLRESMDKGVEFLRGYSTQRQMASLVFSKFGNQYIRAAGFNSDAFVQVAVQLAYHRLHKRPTAVYERISTKTFLHARTEALRSLTRDVMAFVKSVGGSEKPRPGVQLALLRKAIDTHKRLLLEAKQARGVDRHLLGLKTIAEESGIKLPELFTDYAFTESTHFRLFTSNCRDSACILYGFAPLVDDGYGVGYVIDRTSLRFNALNNISPAYVTDSQAFIQALEQSLLEMANIMEEGTINTNTD